MILRSLVAAAVMLFAHDCDKTVVYYDESPESTKLVALPASATGKVGYVAEATLEELSKISKIIPIVCVSGARTATMKTRQPFFPMVKYWICENGGRLFETSVDGSGMVEDEEYTAYINGMVSAQEWQALDSFAKELQQEGWKVDREGYETMMRVSRGSSMTMDMEVKNLAPRIPAALNHTWNLGYLDVQVPGLGKMCSVKWLCDKVALSRGGGGRIEETEYLFFGDDDNDIEAASEALEAFIANPRSEAMQIWMDGALGRQDMKKPTSITTPPDEVRGHAGAVFLLREVRARLRVLLGEVKGDL